MFSQISSQIEMLLHAFGYDLYGKCDNYIKQTWSNDDLLEQYYKVIHVITR